MKILTTIGMTVLVVGTSAFLITKPTYADSHISISTETQSVGTHKVWLVNQSIFKLRRFGEHCMPGDLIKGPIPLNDTVVGTETRECKNVPYRFRRVSYENFSGWMWDFALEEIDPLEGEFPATEDEEVPIIIREEDPLLGSTLPTIQPEAELP